jgi:hypothetical protein
MKQPEKIERHVIDQPGVGTVVCWRVNQGRRQEREISASRLGVLVRGRHDSWLWDVNEGNVKFHVENKRATTRHSIEAMTQRLRRFGGLVELAGLQANRLSIGLKPLPEESEREFLAGARIVTAVAA